MIYTYYFNQAYMLAIRSNHYLILQDLAALTLVELQGVIVYLSRLSVE